MNVISAICTNASLSFFVLFAITLLCSIAYRYNVNPLWLLGFAEAMKILGSVLGLVVGTVFMVDALPVNIQLFTDILVVVLVVLFMIFLSDKDYRGTWGSVPVNADETSAVGAHGQSYFEALLDACAHMAHQYGLTRREEEVVFLLAQNKSLQSIEDELCITTGTAKSHCHHIYTKMGVHKRQELIGLIENDKAMKAMRRSIQAGRQVRSGH
ncbi:response regulator transcription factor [Adlercreutzia sp. ZJ141]|uniref:response regulator transcription factor n=1 Tax=Adlercreutzia sp. ZJ141 TaxID=2709406 RepID=UPI0013EC3EB6|nr:helix-turn-helix transcriptional regulator [Adlercreutzia sp. ZJ141]